ncbi:MAG: hypothetical protein ACREMO_04600 [Gemmatimonadales bacterium]
MRLILFRATFALLLPLAAACRYDSTAPSYAIPDGLWTVSGSPVAVLRLATDQLSGTGERTPAIAITTPSAGLFSIVGVAFDRDGTMWLASQEDSLLLAFAPATLTASGSRAASTIIAPSAGSLSGPTSLAFDRAHHLWVANFGNGTVVRLDPGQLASSGAPAPAVILTGLGHPTAIAFDAAGSLWVSDLQARTVTGFPPMELIASGSPSSSIVLRGAASSLAVPGGLAFDASGNLWVANFGSRTLVAFTAAQLAAGGSPAPDVVVRSTAGSLSTPEGLAFDAGGNLWVMNLGGALEQFGRADLGSSGAPAPRARLVVSGHLDFWSVAFWPKPAGLPLN